MANYLYLDIETIPTSDPAVIADIASGISAPGSMSKPETIAKWEAEQKPQAVADAVAKTSFNGAYGQVCCIGWSWGDGIISAMTVRKDRSEKDILADFAHHLQVSRPSFEQPVIVGHYVADFDIRFLWQRAFVLGVKMPAWFPRDPKPWSKEVHDTMVMWAGAKGSISLDNLCKALGIDGKGDVDGSQVAAMYERGEYDAIAQYCMGDVERTRAVHRKMLVAMGEVE